MNLYKKMPLNKKTLHPSVIVEERAYISSSWEAGIWGSEQDSVISAQWCIIISFIIK